MNIYVKNNLVTKGQRALNFIIDWLIVGIIIFIIGYVLYNFDLSYEKIYKPLNTDFHVHNLP